METKDYKKEFRKLLKNLYRCRLLYLMILPPIVAVFIFHYIPLYGVQIAFKDYRTSLGIWGSEWVGLKHFKKFINYPYFTRMIGNTLRITLLDLCTFPCPIIFALMLNEMKNGKLKKICQQITYAPHFVSTVVVCSMVILFTATAGPINTAINLLGGEGKNLMSDPNWFAPLYIISGEWKGLGWGTIIYLAALSGVSPELIEAAKIDGASRMQIIRHINIPHLKPTMVTLFILRFGSLMSVGFEKTFLLQNPLNLEVSSVISTYTYQIGIENQQFSYSAAVGLFNNIVNVILILLGNMVLKKVTKIGLW